MEFKQNKFLPAEKQIVTANPDINTVSTFYPLALLIGFWGSFFYFYFLFLIGAGIPLVKLNYMIFII